MTPRSLHFRGAALLAAFATLLLGPAVAGASSTQESMFEDDYQLLQRGSHEQARGLDDIASLGADSIRSLVIWNGLAPRPRSKKQPKGFKAANPASYPANLWDRYDDLVRGAQARGMSVLLSPTAPIPAWASHCPGSASARRACKPDARKFGLFVRALGTRYSGTYADENQGGGLLPRIDRWSIWNEPNQPGWLAPQYVAKNGRKVAFAARRYRELVLSAIAGLHRSGHGSDQILLGETAPIGRTSGTLARRPIPPVEFIRELFCLNSGLRRMTGSQAASAGCRRPARFRVSGFAHHPYTRGGSQPPLARTLPGEITISTAARLKRLLAAGAKARRLPGNLPIWYTEFGYQTNPPDRLFGVTLEQQAEFLNQSDWIAFRDGRVRSVSQYKLVDEPQLSSFQTGLRFLDGSAKPAYDAYRLPIWVVRRGSGLRVYGQIRTALDDAAETVEIQSQAPAGGAFQTVQTVPVTSHKGQFVQDVPQRDGVWRLRWLPARGGAPLYSRVAQVGRR
jgi:hypothetical protein